MLPRRTLILRAAIRLNWVQFRPWMALRSALGVALPIVIFTVNDHPEWGVVSALGALMAGMATFHGAYRARARLMLTVSGVMALAAGLGLILADHAPLLVAAVAIISLLLARYTSTAVGGNTVIIQAFTVQTLLLGFPSPQLGPIPTAGLVLAGGLIQTLLLILVWPTNPRRAERNAVAAAYESLAGFVVLLASERASRVPGVRPFQNARAVLTDSRRLGVRPEHHSLFQALRHGEGLHAALVGFAQADLLVRQTGSPGRQHADRTLQVLEGLIQRVAGQVRQGQLPVSPFEGLLDFEQAVHRMEERLSPADRSAHQEYLYWTEILLVQLKLLAQSAAVPSTGVLPPVAAPFSFGPSLALRPVLHGHMVRFTATMTLATIIERLLQIPNGFWVPLTVCLVLRPEFAVTIHRGVTRIAGTVVGVGLALAVMLLWHPAGLALAGLLIVAAWLAYALFLTNYGVFSAAITVYIILSLHAAGAAGEVTAISIQRLLATLVGGVIALGSYLLWPTWHAAHVWEVMTQAVEAQREYARSLARWMEGAGEEPLEERRGYARWWRLRADDLLQAAVVEPRWTSTIPKALALTLLTRLNANAAALLAIQVQVESGSPERREALPEQFGRCLRETQDLRGTLRLYSPAPEQ